MFLVNQFDRVVEITDQAIIAKRLAENTMRYATDEEVTDYKAKREMMNQSVPSADSIFYQTVASSADGYGMSRDFIKSELARLGVHLAESFGNQKIGLLYNYPYSVLQMKTDVRLIYTMFESDKIPEEWPDYLNAANEVLVPSKFCQDVFRKSGVESTVVPLGYNDKLYTYIERPIPVEDGKDFVFIHYDSFNMRKGFSEVISAFSQEFDTNEPVKLILKTVHETTLIPIVQSQYPNVEVIRGIYSERDLIGLLARSNCMVYPSRGEGFGLTPLEAMATGLPAIVPNAHGISEYFNSAYMLEVKVNGSCPGLYNKWKGQDVGNMVVCDVQDLRKQMRYAYNHQAEMKQLGKDASEYAKRYTYHQTALNLAKIISKWQVQEVEKRTDSKFLIVEEF